MEYKLNKVGPNRGESYVDSLGCLKKVAINPKDNDNKCFQYILTIVLNYQIIKSYPEE